MITTELALVLYMWERGGRAFAVWVTSAPWQYNKNWTLEDFLLKGLLFSERPGCSCIFPSIMSFWLAHRAMGITVTFSSTYMMYGFCFFTQPSWDRGKSASKRLVLQTVTEANFGSHEHREQSSGPWIPETRVHQRTGEVCLSAREDLAWGRPWRSSLVNCRVHSERKAQHSTDNHPATPEKSRNLPCECNLIMQVHHATQGK